MGNVTKLMAHMENNALKTVKPVLLDLGDRLELKVQVKTRLSIGPSVYILYLNLKCLHSQTK